MGNVTTRLNLAGLKNAAIIKSGKNKDVDCILIPIEQNHLFKGANGTVYLDTIGFEKKTKDEKSKDTHIVKQSFNKDIRDKMTDEEARAMPILGNHVVWGAEGSGYTEQGANEVASEDDLPF